MSLSDAIGEAMGIDTRTSEGREIFVARQPTNEETIHNL